LIISASATRLFSIFMMPVALAAMTPVETSKYSWGLDGNVERQRQQAALDTMKGCMAQKGYLLVSAEQAETVREQFAATAAQRRAVQNPSPASPTTTKKKPPPTS
jgi:hypothetical protein